MQMGCWVGLFVVVGTYERVFSFSLTSPSSHSVSHSW